MLVAKEITVHRDIKKFDCQRFKQFFFEIEYNGNYSDPKVKGDLYLTRVRDFIHGVAMSFLGVRVFDYYTANDRMFSFNSEYLVFHPRIRRPSLAIFSRFQRRETDNSTVLFEVEFEPRSLQTMHAFCLEYFCKPCVRSVLLFKFSRRLAEPARLFSAVGVMYRRGPRGAPLVADAVSFGTLPVSADLLDPALAEVARALRVLPPAPHGEALWSANPWDPVLRPFLAVPPDDIYYLGDVPPAASQTGDFVVDLWRLLQAIEPFEWPVMGRARGL